MKSLKKQKGLSIISLILVLAVGGFVLIFGAQMALAYITQQTLRGAVKNALIEAKNNDTATSRTVKEAIMRKLAVNTIEVKDSIFDISKSTGGFEVSTDFVKEVKVTDRVKIVMDLSFTEETK